MQLEFPFRDEAGLHKELERRAGIKLALTVTDNTSSIMTLKHDDRHALYKLRIHRMFLSAEPKVLSALAHWITSKRKRPAHALIDDYINKNLHLVDAAKQRRTVTRTKGRYFNLNQLFNEVNKQHFDNTITSTITWGRMPAPRRRTSIRFGSFTPDENLIRIHPLLDQAFVPNFFVRYIVFHEMLHAHLGIAESPTGRRRIHTLEFNRIERTYPDYDIAIKWMDTPANLNRLLRTTRAKAV